MIEIRIYIPSNFTRLSHNAISVWALDLFLVFWMESEASDY